MKLDLVVKHKAMNSRWRVLVVLVLLNSFGLIGCGSQEGNTLSDQTKAIVAGNNAFALDLYRQFKSANSNVVFSPFSVSACLAMSYAGARSETEKQMAQVLHFRTSQVHSAFGELGIRFKQAQNWSGIELSMANGLWLPKAHPPLPAFLDIVRQQYDAEVGQFDFGTEAEATRSDINAWVSRKTKGKLNAIIPAGMLKRDSKLLLVNAVYFRGAWKTKFDPRNTRAFDFHVDSQRAVQCPMMFCSGKFLFYYHDGSPCSCEVLELPYVGKHFSFIAILPIVWDGLAEVEDNLTQEKLATLLASVRESDVYVTLPKFRLEAEFSLDGTLSAMGMSDAFGPNADFSGVDGTKMLYITSVQHRTFVEVNKAGTTAAAATASHYGTKGMSPSFRADHPFLFLIRDNFSGSILFLGKLVDPSK